MEDTTLVQAETLDVVDQEHAQEVARPLARTVFELLAQTPERAEESYDLQHPQPGQPPPPTYPPTNIPGGQTVTDRD